MKSTTTKIYNQWWFWLIISITIIALTLIIVFFNQSHNNSSDYGVGSAGISLEEFEKITIGSTTMWDISNIIDKNDEWNNNDIYNKVVEEIEDSKSEHIYKHVYKYLGENSGYALITFEADYSNGYFYNDFIVTKKENFNLK